MLLERDKPVDWNMVILTLRKWGWTIKAIADSINVAESTVQHWVDYGKEPQFENGRALLKLYEREEKCFGKAKAVG